MDLIFITPAEEFPYTDELVPLITSIFLCHGGNYWYRQVALTRKKLSNFL